MFANACAPPTASSSISHSVLVEESIHTGESEIENAFANWEWRNPLDDFRLCNILLAPVLQYTLPCCYRKKKRHSQNICIIFYYIIIETQNDITPEDRSKLTCPAPLMATTCEKSIPDILILSNKMSRALTHINVGDVIRPFFEFDPWTPPVVRYSGNSKSYCTHSLASNCKFPLITTALSWNRRVKDWL